MTKLIVDGGNNWPFEQIEFDPADPEKLPTDTYQYRCADPKRVRYVVRSEWNKAAQQLSIEYRAEGQKYLPEDGPSAECAEFWGWGVHILTIECGKKCGPSSWKQELYPEECGPGWSLERLSGGKKRKRKLATQIKREQQGVFRDQLLEMDGCCALTRETCERSLEAAHIIPARQGGQEYPENGMLLRADIHRLFDAEKFLICPKTGKVLVERNFEYRSFTLQGARVLEDVLERIRTALQKRSDDR